MSDARQISQIQIPDLRSQRFVGLFWDIASIHDACNADFSNHLKYLKSICSSFSVSASLDRAKIFGDKKCNTTWWHDILEAGFEFIEVGGDSADSISPIASEISSWCNLCHSVTGGATICVIVVSNDTDLKDTILQSLSKNTSFVLLSDDIKEDFCIRWSSVMSMSVDLSVDSILRGAKPHCTIDDQSQHDNVHMKQRHTRKYVGLFWDVQSLPVPKSCATTSEHIHTIQKLASLYSSSSSAEMSMAFHVDFVSACADVVEALYREGFEVVSTYDKNLADHASSCIQQWVGCIYSKDTIQHCDIGVVLVTRNNQFASLLQSLCNINVYVVVVTDVSAKDLEDLLLVANDCINIPDMKDELFEELPECEEEKQVNPEDGEEWVEHEFGSSTTSSSPAMSSRSASHSPVWLSNVLTLSEASTTLSIPIHTLPLNPTTAPLVVGQDSLSNNAFNSIITNMNLAKYNDTCGNIPKGQDRVYAQSTTHTDYSQSSYHSSHSSAGGGGITTLGSHDSLDFTLFGATPVDDDYYDDDSGVPSPATGYTKRGDSRVSSSKSINELIKTELSMEGVAGHFSEDLSSVKRRSSDSEHMLYSSIIGVKPPMQRKAASFALSGLGSDKSAFRSNSMGSLLQTGTFPTLNPSPSKSTNFSAQLGQPLHIEIPPGFVHDPNYGQVFITSDQSRSYDEQASSSSDREQFSRSRSTSIQGISFDEYGSYDRSCIYSSDDAGSMSPLSTAGGRDPIHDVLDSITQDQYNLYQSLAMAFTTRNSKVAVSTLRQVYTKQCRRFRIPNLLSIIIPETLKNSPTLEFGQLNYEGIVFSLNCMLGCFTGKKLDSMDSFKYKMNKNIARWLLKEQQRKGIPAALPPDILELSMTVAKHVYECTADLEFGMEILIAYNVSNPKTVLTPAPTDVIFSDGPYTASSTVISNVAGAPPGLGPPPGMTPGGGAVPEMWKVEKRLIGILERALPDGLLGAHIPSIYKEEFGEPIYLHGRKLKDVLLGTNLVDMLGGGNSPGGKKFVLRAGAAQERIAAANLTHLHGMTPFKNQMQGLFSDSPLTTAIRNQSPIVAPQLGQGQGQGQGIGNPQQFESAPLLRAQSLTTNQGRDIGNPQQFESAPLLRAQSLTTNQGRDIGNPQQFESAPLLRAQSLTTNQGQVRQSGFHSPDMSLSLRFFEDSPPKPDAFLAPRSPTLAQQGSQVLSPGRMPSHGNMSPSRTAPSSRAHYGQPMSQQLSPELNQFEMGSPNSRPFAMSPTQHRQPSFQQNLQPSLQQQNHIFPLAPLVSVSQRPRQPPQHFPYQEPNMISALEIGSPMPYAVSPSRVRQASFQQQLPVQESDLVTSQDIIGPPMQYAMIPGPSHMQRRQPSFQQQSRPNANQSKVSPLASTAAMAQVRRHPHPQQQPHQPRPRAAADVEKFEPL